jgi:hypothetical protein
LSSKNNIRKKENISVGRGCRFLQYIDGVMSLLFGNFHAVASAFFGPIQSFIGAGMFFSTPSFVYARQARGATQPALE